MIFCEKEIGVKDDYKMLVIFTKSLIIPTFYEFEKKVFCAAFLYVITVWLCVFWSEENDAKDAFIIMVKLRSTLTLYVKKKFRFSNSIKINFRSVASKPSPLRH